VRLWPIVQTNDIFENAILAYARSADGTVTLPGRYRHGPRWCAGLRRVDELAAVVANWRARTRFGMSAISRRIARVAAPPTI
jgi:hypothetical protein